jgi:hypothetical protein
MWFIRKEGNQQILEILEFSCPFGRIEEGESTLKLTYDYKLNKYQPLADKYISNTRHQARVHPIIVSSLGAVYHESMICLKSIFRCSDKEIAKLGTWMSEQAILGSFKLWIEYQRTNHHHHQEQEQVSIEVNIANQENIEDIEIKENDDEEEDTEENDHGDDTRAQRIRTSETEVSELAEAIKPEETRTPETEDSDLAEAIESDVTIASELENSELLEVIDTEETIIHELTSETPRNEEIDITDI